MSYTLEVLKIGSCYQEKHDDVITAMRAALDAWKATEGTDERLYTTVTVYSDGGQTVIQFPKED